MSSSTNTAPKKPLNCPKGYGLCYACETWCDGGTAETPLPEPKGSCYDPDEYRASDYYARLGL